MTDTTGKNKRRKMKRHTFTKKLTDNAITNLSDYTLTDDEKNLLNKGLSFVPQHHFMTRPQTFIQAFRHKIYTAHHFKDQTSSQEPLHRNTGWEPPTPTNQHLLSLMEEVKHIMGSLQSFNTPRMSLNEEDARHIAAIKSLTDNTTITIKKADKGGSTVIMNTTDYINTALTHLRQGQIYIEADKDNTRHTYDEVNSFITQMHKTGRITDRVAKYITPTTPPRTSLFYYLPKIHKPNNPPRPIISGVDSPTDQCSKLLTKILQPIAEAQPSYLKDTKHLLQILIETPKITKDTFLVTADVTSLYTNIPHDEGISVIIDAINKHRDLTPIYTPDNEIIKLILSFILKHNQFDFMDKHYKQIQGTAMGTKMAPPYANIFMSYFETPLMTTYSKHILLWKRYIDDILFLWRGTRKSLEQFTQHTNNLHPTIKLTFEISTDEINFLDTTIYVDKRNYRLCTTLYRKPTNKNLILHYTSKHPLHVKRGIVYSQALRYKRIISSKKHLGQEINTLKQIFIARGYPMRLIHQQVDKALKIPRTSLLMDKPRKQNNDRRGLSLPIPFHPQHTYIKRRIKQAWQRIRQDPKLDKL